MGVFCLIVWLAIGGPGGTLVAHVTPCDTQAEFESVLEGAAKDPLVQKVTRFTCPKTMIGSPEVCVVLTRSSDPHEKVWWFQ